MRIAVLTLTRDRLDYTKHCFAALHEYAGCDFDHYVLDNHSTHDQTANWLVYEYMPNNKNVHVITRQDNIGIARGLNELLDTAGEGYDAIVHFDNDCELVQPNTIRDVCDLAIRGGAILSPRILGLQNPPQPLRELRIGDEVILDINQIGGICLTAPGWWYDDGYRYPDDLPLWGLDDAHICHTFREAGGTCGYVKRLEAWHYESTTGQRERYPEYFVRKDAEYAGLAA